VDEHKANVPKTGKRGRPKKDKVVPDERLKYAQVVKQREGMRVVAIVKRIVFGAAIKLKMTCALCSANPDLSLTIILD